MHAIKGYVRKTGLDGNSNKSVTLTKVLKLIYSVKKGAKSYYDILTPDEIIPRCCIKWDDKLNTNINWKNIFQKVQKIPELN